MFPTLIVENKVQDKLFKLATKISGLQEEEKSDRIQNDKKVEMQR